MHKFNNLKSFYHFLKNFLARCACSIAFYPPLRNESTQCALPTPFIYIFLFSWVIIPDWQLPKFTENTHKLHKIAYTMSKTCLRRWQKKSEGGGRRENGERHGCWGIDAHGDKCNGQGNKAQCNCPIIHAATEHLIGRPYHIWFNDFTSSWRSLHDCTTVSKWVLLKHNERATENAGIWKWRTKFGPAI